MVVGLVDELEGLQVKKWLMKNWLEYCNKLLGINCYKSCYRMIFPESGEVLYTFNDH